MIINFIRHGLTQGNSEKRYIGRTDSSLSEEGRELLNHTKYPRCDIVLCSPMLRCVQTAEIIFPHNEIMICDEFRECDFGDFEGKNYAELNGDPVYQQWIDSGGKMPFPNGESPDGFRERSCMGFIKRVADFSDDSEISLVVHGGTIMSVMERYAVPKKEFYEWYTENGHGYICELDTVGKIIKVKEKI